TYAATSGTTTITRATDAATNMAWDCDGTFTHNSGTVNFTDSSGFTYIDGACTGAGFNNATFDGGATWIDQEVNNVPVSDTFTLNAGVFRQSSTSGDITIVGDVVLNGGTMLGGVSHSGDMSFGSLTINSGGTYSATSGTTTITSENPSNWAINCDGTFTANSGTVNITNPSTSNADINCTGNVYNLEVGGNTVNWAEADTTIDNDLTVTDLFRASSDVLALTVTGDVVIDNGGTLGDGEESTLTFGSLKINSGGTYSATSGTTTITSTNGNGWAIRNTAAGTYTHNNGLVNLTGSISIFGSTQPFYNLVVSSANQRYSNQNLVVEGNLTVDGGSLFNGNGEGSLIINTTGDVVIAESGSGTLGGNGATGAHYFGSLTINSGGTYAATTGTTTITSETVGGFAINHDGTLNNNTGIFNVTTVDATLLDLTGTGNLNDLVMNTSSTASIVDTTTIDGDLNISSGTFQSNNDNRALTITGDVVINEGQLDSGSEAGARSFGSLTINSGGTYSATSGTTTMKGAFDSNGTFTHNNGNVRFMSSPYIQWNGISEPVFYNISTDGEGYPDIRNGNITVINNMHVDNRAFRIRNTIVTFGNSTQAATLTGDAGNIIQVRGSMSIYGASQSYPANITRALSFYEGADIRLKWLDFQLTQTTDSTYSSTISLDGDTWFRTLSINSGDTLNLTDSATSYVDTLTLNGGLTAGSGNLTNNTNTQWNASFDSGTYTWNSTNISEGNNTGSLVINAQTATDGGNNVPPGMWNFGTAGEACLFSANDTLTANLSCTTLQVESAATVVTSTYSINTTGNAEINGTLNASQGGTQQFDSMTINSVGTYENPSASTTTVTDKTFVNSGTFLAGTGNLSLGSAYTAEYGMEVKGTFMGGSGDHTYGSLKIETGDMNFTSGTTTISSQTSNLAIVFSSGVSYAHNSGTINFTGSDNQQLYDAANTARTLYNVEIDKASNKVQYWNGKGFALTVSNLTITSGEFESYEATSGTARNLIASGDVDVSGTLDCNAGSGTVSATFGALAINSGGTYSATSGTTTLTATTTGVNYFYYNNGGTFTHNSGTVLFDRAAGSGAFYVREDSGHTGTLYNVIINNTEPVIQSRTQDISGNLTVNAGAEYVFGNAADRYLNVSGDVIINGSLTDDGNSVDATFGSLTINSGGTYSATSGTTTTTSEIAGTALESKSGSTFTHNNGTVNITNVATHFDFAGTGNPYDLVVSTGFQNGTEFDTSLTVDNDVTVESGTLMSDTTAQTLTVTGDAVINNNGKIWANSGSQAFTFGSLKINSGGTYDATSGTTTITNETAGGYSIDNDGTFTANSGTVNITLNSAHTEFDLTGTSGNLYNLEINTGSYRVDYRDPTIDNNLTVSSGTFYPNSVSTTLTVTGDVEITGTLGKSAHDGANSFGSLTINSGGTYTATNGTTTITSENVAGNAFIASSGSTFTANSGTVNISSGTATHIDFAGGSPYDLVIDATGTNNVPFDTSFTVANDLTIQSGVLYPDNSISTGSLTVTGDAIINGRLGNRAASLWSGSSTLGSLTINSGGTYDATSGNTTLNGAATRTGSGVFIHNEGTMVKDYVSGDWNGFTGSNAIYNYHGIGSYTADGNSITIINLLSSEGVAGDFNLYINSVLTLGNASQSGTIDMASISEFDYTLKYSNTLQGASQAYPAIIQDGAMTTLSGSGTLTLKWVDWQQAFTTGGYGTGTVDIIGDSWFRNFTVAANDTLNITNSATLYTDVLDLSGNLTSGAGNITNNTNSQWLAYFDSATSYTWDSTNISQGNNTGAVVINALTATDGGNNVPAAMWKFSEGSVTLGNPNTSWTVGANATFDCSATSTDVALVNISLYQNNTGTWHNNGTVSVSGTSASAQFNVTGLQENGFEWYCEACDGASCDVSSENWTITSDQTTPSISFLADVWSDLTRIATWREVVVNLTSSDTNNQSTFVDWNRTLVGYWSFDQVSGSTVSDNSSWSNDGTAVGATPTQGKFGKAMSFDGSGDYITVTDHDSIDPTEAWTLEAWIHRNETGTQHSVLEKYDWSAGKGNYALRVTSGNRIIAYVINGTSSANCGSASTIINAGEWYHFVATFDSNTNTLACYVNGDLDVQNTGATINPPSSTGTLNIGARGDDAGTKFNGAIDEVKIYSRALSAGEILAEYDANANQYNKTWTGLTEGQSYTYTGYNFDLGANANNTEERTVTINNIPTAYTSVNITATSDNNLTEDNLTLYWTEGTDADSDAVVNITDWRRNGTSIAVLNMPFDTNRSGQTGSYIRDYSTFENNGTFGTGSAEPTWTSSGQIGGAYTFDGVDDYINVSDDSTLNFNTNLKFTISAWVKGPATQEGGAAIVTKGYGSGNEQYSIDIDSGNFRFYVWDATTPYVASTTTSPDNSWQYVTAVFDYENSRMKIYVDGVEVGSTTPPSSLVSTSEPVTIGSRKSSSGSGYDLNFNGSIDEVKIFNRSLTANQILEEYSAGLAGHSVQNLSFNETAISDIWTTAVTPNDLYEDGTTTISASVNLAATAPTAPTSLIPTSGTWGGWNETVAINCSGSTDEDGSDIYYYIQSNVTGSWANIVEDDADGYYDWNISTYNNTAGINLRCFATDWLFNSSWYNESASLNIDNAEPTWSDVNKNESTIWNGWTVMFNTTWTESQVADMGLAGFMFATNDSGSWENSTYYEFSGTTNTSNFTRQILTSAGSNVGWYFWANDSLGNENETTIQEFPVGSKSISIAISSELSAGVRWIINQLPTARGNATGNNDTSDTDYYVTVTSTGTNVDLSMAADGNLTTDGGAILELDYEEYRYNTSESAVTNSDYYTMALSNSTIGRDLVSGITSYLKFYLTVPGNQSVGIYNNTIAVYAEEAAL
ncbi:hypothetical protein HN777_00425, partial [Candidatus Woesearchaeota archaeon]|nr:hypothetical protein [Candidatus Woesearchaeota archaeon]